MSGPEGHSEFCFLRVSNIEIWRKHRRTSWRRGGEGKGDCRPPSFENYVIIQTKRLMIWATTLKRKHSKITMLAWFPKLVNKISIQLYFTELFLLISFTEIFLGLRLLIEYDWLSEYASFEYNYFWNCSSFISCWNCEGIFHAFRHCINVSGKKVTALQVRKCLHMYGGKHNSLFAKGLVKTNGSNWWKTNNHFIDKWHATAVNISRVRVNCFPFDGIVFALLPARGI